MVRKGHAKLSISAQCRLLSLHRSGLYYRPRGETALNLELMRLMDEHYLHHSEKGAIRMYTWLIRNKGYQISKNRIERLYYQVMGLRAMLPGRHTSKKSPERNKVYPNLLYKLDISRPNQVWAVDSTYIPMREGYMYLMAIIDLFGRSVVHWNISNSMDALWCTKTLQEAIELHGKPEIIHIDRASQYTSEVFTKAVLQWEIKLSVDAKRSITKHVFVKGLWKSVKYDTIYPHPSNDGLELFLQLKAYFERNSNIKIAETND